MMKDLVPRPRALALALALIAGAIIVIEQPYRPHSSIPDPPADIPASELQYPGAPDFRGATGWLGTPGNTPLVLEELRGQVVLVDFWTYSCINCIHTFPHVQGWWERYKADGFVVVGVHTPEFRFERDAANVQAARERYGLTYPVAQDNDYGIWSAYGNRYWPAKYLVDPYGRIRHTHFGEGGYVETEEHIRKLLAEAGRPTNATRVEPLGEEAHMRHTPELYAAAAQGLDRVAIGNAEGYNPGRTTAYARPSTLAPDRIFLVGSWAATNENVTSTADAGVLVRFTAGAGNFVADGPRDACVPVLLDGAAATPALAGPGVRFDRGAPCIVLDGPRSYDFFAGPPGEHTVELKVPAGFTLFTFVFSSNQETG